MEGAPVAPGVVAAPANAGASLLAVPIPPGTATSLVAEMSSDLSFLMETNNVPFEIQARVSELGFKVMATWAMLDDSAAGVREFIIKDVGIKAEGNPQYRSHISGLLASWKAAKQRGDERHKAEAEQRVHSLPRKISEQEHMEMLNAYVALHGPLKEREIPAEAYIEQKLSQVEDGKIKADKLSSVCGQDDVDDDDLSSARLRNDGTVMVVRGTKLNTSMPTNAE